MLGIITQIVNILEKVTLGSHFLKTAILLRGSVFLNGILTNAESWHGLSSTHIRQLESMDKLLIRKLLNTPVTTHIESMYIEHWLLSLNTTIKACRLNFQHFLVTRSKVKWSKEFSNNSGTGLLRMIWQLQCARIYRTFKLKKVWIKSKVNPWMSSRNM